MSRVRWAALALGAGVLLASGCSLCNRPMLMGRCCGERCMPECEGCAMEAPFAEGPMMEGYPGPMMEGYPGGAVLPGPAAPGMPAVPAVPPASPMLPPLNPPGGVGPLVPQPTVPQLSPPRLVPMPQSQPEAYRP